MSEQNGAGKPKGLTLEDVRSWVIAYVEASQGFVGRPVDSSPGVVVLSPVYALLGGYQIGPQGAGRMMICAPVEMLPGVVRLEVRYGALIRLSELEELDFKKLGGDLLARVGVAEQMKQAIRAQRSGVMIAPPNLKLPPLRGL